MSTVGDDIEDVCARCGESWHVIMAKMADKIAKVVCKRCGSQHSYRGPDGIPEPAPGANPTPGKRTFRRRAAKHTEPTSGPPPPFDPSKPPRTYSPRDMYQPGERIDHPAFGVGVVAGNPGPGKVDVSFPSAMRTLACTKATSTLERPVAATNVPIADRPPDAMPMPMPARRKSV
jgi:ribosomal protein S27AE